VGAEELNANIVHFKALLTDNNDDKCSYDLPLAQITGVSFDLKCKEGFSAHVDDSTVNYGTPHGSYSFTIHIPDNQKNWACEYDCSDDDCKDAGDRSP
jgi:hypothetical protein